MECHCLVFLFGAVCYVDHSNVANGEVGGIWRGGRFLHGVQKCEEQERERQVFHGGSKKVRRERDYAGRKRRSETTSDADLDFALLRRLDSERIDREFTDLRRTKASGVPSIGVSWSFEATHEENSLWFFGVFCADELR